MKTRGRLFVTVFLLFLVVGCASLLPTGTMTIKSPWWDFDSAKADYEKITPGGNDPRRAV